MVIRDERVNMKTFKSHLEEGRKVTEKDLIKALKKDRSRSPSLLILVYHNGKDIWVGIDMDSIKNKDGNSYFGTDDDGNEIEFNIKDVSRIQ